MCRAFLDEHATKAATVMPSGKSDPDGQVRLQVAAQQESSSRIGIGRTAASRARVDTKQAKKRSVSGRQVVSGKQSAKCPSVVVDATQPPNGVSGSDTALTIPFGNKEVALELGARYRPGGWYAPSGVALDSFRERGWL